MTSREHGIIKPHKLFNLHSSTQSSISSLPNDFIDELNYHNWKMTIKDDYNAFIENNMWDFPSLSNANVFEVCGFASIRRI